ncbi:MAG: transcription elongation factor subunit Spt4 [Candidatus Woesearchaeota archaeon]
MKKKVCKKCRLFIEDEQAKCPFSRPDCHLNNPAQFTNLWNGRIHFLNIENSRIAKEMSVEKEGEYAIKVR